MGDRKATSQFHPFLTKPCQLLHLDAITINTASAVVCFTYFFFVFDLKLNGSTPLGYTRYCRLLPSMASDIFPGDRWRGGRSGWASSGCAFGG